MFATDYTRFIVAAAGLAILPVAACGESNSSYTRLKTFYDGNTALATQCLLYASLMSEAYDSLKMNNSVDATASGLSEKYRAKLKAEELPRFSEIAFGVSSIADGLRPLEKDSALVAYMQICKSQAEGLKPNINVQRLNAADQCGKTFAPGLSRKNCVVAAFEVSASSK